MYSFRWKTLLSVLVGGRIRRGKGKRVVANWYRIYFRNASKASDAFLVVQEVCSETGFTAYPGLPLNSSGLSNATPLSQKKYFERNIV